MLRRFKEKKPALYKDYPQLLEDDSIDAVISATPDHWHCKMMVDAVEAGKHVYVEKPLANSIQECNIMVDTVERTGKNCTGRPMATQCSPL